MARIHILYVEKDRSEREALAEELEKHGFRITALDSGQAALEAFASGTHDVILCDLNLPDVGGRTLLPEIRRRSPATPVVLLTARETVDQAVEAVRHGDCHLVLKPISVDDVEITINEALERARLQIELENVGAQLVQFEKMASLGMLVAGIAHEINTPVGAINSMHDTLTRAVEKLKETLRAADLAEADKSRIEPILDVIDDANRIIDSGTERVTTIVQRLRSFARLDETELKEVDIHEGIEDTLALIQHEIKNRITVVRRFGDIPPVACYPGRINQVFLNLLNNARQAIDGEGTITISTEVVAGRLEVRFEDTGQGIAPENLPRIFDPGFTTKAAGVGTGLGLSICHQIVEDHRGEIRAASKVGQGTTITVVLPLDLEAQLESDAGKGADSGKT